MHDDTTATEFGAAMDKYRTAADVIDVIEGEGWAVEDYDLTVDRFGDRQGLTLELEPTPTATLDSEAQRDLWAVVKEAVDVFDTDSGAPEDEVVDHVTAQLDVADQQVRDTLDKMRTKGEVYEPVDDHLRRT